MGFVGVRHLKVRDHDSWREELKPELGMIQPFTYMEIRTDPGVMF